MPDPIYDAAQARQLDHDDYRERRERFEPRIFERETMRTRFGRNQSVSGKAVYVHEDDEGVQFEFEVEYTAYPGEPMVMYDRDGGGYPGSPPGVEFYSARCVSMVSMGDSGSFAILSDEDAAALGAKFIAQVMADKKLFSSVESCCFEHVAERDEP